jgi:hypothetical protein
MKKNPVYLVVAALACVCLTAVLAIAQEQAGKVPDVRINGSVMPPELLQEFEALYGVKPVPGDYWYDTISGLYGNMGQPAAGMMMPGHMLGQMPENASDGNSGVFVNGRHLTMAEVNYIAGFLQTAAIPGRYWFDAYGNWGVEGLPVPLVNFYEVARSRSGSGGGDNFWSSHFSAGNYDSGNSRGYVSVPGHGPVGYGF